MTRHIGGHLDLGALSRLHQPANTQQLADARHATRQAIAALRAVDPVYMRGDDWTALYGLLCGRLGEDRARVETFVLEERVNGEMRLARERLEELSRQTIALMQSERRNGILMASRRIKALEAAIGPDA